MTNPLASVRAVALVIALGMAGTASGAESAVDSVATGARPSLQILLQNGDTLHAWSARLTSLGLVQLTLLDGSDSVLSANRVKTITDERGRDRTNEVLLENRNVGVGGPGPVNGAQVPVEKPKLLPGDRGPIWTTNVGFLSPIGSFGDVAEPGLALESAVEWRPRRHETYGITLEYAEMGGDPDLESYLSTTTGGDVDEVRYRQWGASVTARYLIRPDHRVVPFIRTSLGARSFSTSLRGPAADGSKSALALAQDLGLGVIVRLGKAVSADLSAGYTRVTKGESTTTAGAANFSSKGTMQYLQFRGGLMRRFGGVRASD